MRVVMPTCKGGHLPGEIVLLDYTHHLAFTGDVYINIHGLTPEQAAYNQYAPILMTSVDTDPKLCAEERKSIISECLKQLAPCTARKHHETARRREFTDVALLKRSTVLPLFSISTRAAS